MNKPEIKAIKKIFDKFIGFLEEIAEIAETTESAPVLEVGSPVYCLTENGVVYGYIAVVDTDHTCLVISDNSYFWKDLDTVSYDPSREPLSFDWSE